MDFGFELEQFGKHFVIHFKKNTPGWKRFVSELTNDRVILDIKNAKKMIEINGDSVVYEVYHLWKSIDQIKHIHEKTGLACDITFLNFGVFSPSGDGELFLTYGHIHEKPMGEAYTILKNDCFFVLADYHSHRTYIIRLDEGDSILVHPKYLHRIVSFKKDCLAVGFTPSKTGHNYDVVRNKGFPFHIFFKNRKLDIVKNKKYKNGKFKLIKKTTCKINPVKLFEKDPKKLKDILENPEKYKNLYFIGK